MLYYTVKLLSYISNYIGSVFMNDINEICITKTFNYFNYCIIAQLFTSNVPLHTVLLLG